MKKNAVKKVIISLYHLNTKVKMFGKQAMILCPIMFIVFQGKAQESPKKDSPVTVKRGINFHGQIGTYLLTTLGKIKTQGKNEANATIANGLLPASLSALPYLEKGDIKMSGNFTAYISLNNYVDYNGTISDAALGGKTSGGTSRALQTNFVEFMQAYVEISHQKYGTFLLGRNFGLYAKDAAFEDVSVLGVGVSRNTSIPRQVHDLGLGYGYVFCDKYPQMNYTTPTFGGVNFTIGAYQPLNQDQSGGSLGIQSRITYSQNINEKTKLYLSSSLISQKTIDKNDATAQSELRGLGWDIFGKLTIQRLTLSGQYNMGQGLGYYGLFLGATKTDDNGKLVNASSRGYYAQVSYSTPKGFTVAANYGSSQIEKGGFFGASEGNPTSRITVTLSQMITGAFLARIEYTNMSKNMMLGVIEPRNLIAIGGTFLF